MNYGEMISPDVTDEEIFELCQELFGIKVSSIVKMNGYDDKNYKIQIENVNNSFLNKISSDGYTLKIMNSLDSQNLPLIEAQSRMMEHLGNYGFRVPQPIKNINNKCYSLKKLGKQNTFHVVRILTFQVGNLLKNVKIGEKLCYNLGRYLFEIDQTLKTFHHAAYQTHDSLWMLHNAPQLLKYIFVINDLSKQKLIESVINEFTKTVIPEINNLEKGMIHGDYNEQNILVNEENIIALLDFGDAQYSPYLFEVAIGLCYLLLETKNISSGNLFLKGYSTSRTFHPIELKLLKICVCARICQSIVLGTYCHLKNPENNYLLFTQKAGWEMLQKLYNMDEDELKFIWNIS